MKSIKLLVLLCFIFPVLHSDFPAGFLAFQGFEQKMLIDQQIAQHFVQYSEFLLNAPSLLCHSNNSPFS